MLSCNTHPEADGSATYFDRNPSRLYHSFPACFVCSSRELARAGAHSSPIWSPLVQGQTFVVGGVGNVGKRLIDRSPRPGRLCRARTPRSEPCLCVWLGTSPGPRDARDPPAALEQCC